MISESKTYKAVPSYYLILDYLNKNNIDINDFQKRMGWSHYEIKMLESGCLLIKPEIAKKIEEAIGLKGEELLKHEREYRQNIIKVMLENELGIIVK